MYKKIEKGVAEQGKTKLIKIMRKVCNFLLKFGIDIRSKVFKQILDQFGGRIIFSIDFFKDRKIFIIKNNGVSLTSNN